ncbi:MAG: response regulator [Anaeromyxobacter sp.]|nr:response regulator [Anaeromyxobacter sp.]MBL0276997.1 response regulator [Anaeromyxobacter sp.]
MGSSSAASALQGSRAVAGVPAGVREFADEATALRALLLELRADLPQERGPARESDRARFAEALAALGELAITTEEIEPLVASACTLVLETLDVDGVALLQETRAPAELLVRAAAGCLLETKGTVMPAGEATQAGFALASRGSTATADARAAWMGDRFLATHDLVAAALVTLPGFARPRVLLGAYAGRRRAFAPDEIRFLEAAAGSLSAALARCRAEADRKELQARLATADRMVSVGTLAAGVAHELNNPLAYVNANITFLAEQTVLLASLLPASARADEEVADVLIQLRDAARDARDGVERMRVIVRDLKSLSRADDSKVGPVELGPVLDSCINVAGNAFKHRARLVKDLRPLPAVRGNEARLGQIFLNLLINASQAVPEGAPEQHEIRITTRPQGDDHVVVEFSDTGCGIAPEVLPRIFDPFFTTKPPGVGTGLGLSIVHGIVAAMKGEIQVQSTPGRGSTFRVVLPVAGHDPADDEQDALPPATTPGRRRARILVVDDEPLVGTVLQRTLGSDHEIVCCGGARAALDRVLGGEPFDLVFSDLQMPEMTGMDLHRELARSRPDLASRMVFLTGGACTDAARDFLMEPGRECLEKPFDLPAIRAVLARRLAAPAAPATSTARP